MTHKINPPHAFRYRINSEALREAIEQHAANEHDYTAVKQELPLLRALVERACEALADDPATSLKQITPALEAISKMAYRIEQTEIARGQLLTKSTVMAVAGTLVEVMTEALNTFAPEARDQIVDYAVPKFCQAVEEARNDK